MWYIQGKISEKTHDCALGDQEKNWALHISCLTCATTLTEWMKRNCCAMPFSIPMVWHESKDHFSDCYFCLTNIAGHSSRSKHTIKYPDASSVLKCVPHEMGQPVPQPYLEPTESGPSQKSAPEDAQPSEEYLPERQDKSPHPISQKEMNDLVHALN
jgi:hypothetical protein